ncbi:hypothetical protein MLD38_019189 [Melastoma candidum]|uniref:Uncharacterized protein n=1 Tax=Melastoma candidum TaxID=119954 RepID=A0ACB9QXI1_9MYRT|nr:hypothetical protein MLD38_019189 [Melastoma candidum]
MCGICASVPLHAPGISQLEFSRMGWNTICPAYATDPYPVIWNCRSCLKAQCGLKAGCGARMDAPAGTVSLSLSSWGCTSSHSHQG